MISFYQKFSLNVHANMMSMTSKLSKPIISELVIVVIIMFNLCLVGNLTFSGKYCQT